MAYTAVFTKGEVIQHSEKIYLITINVSITDEGAEIFDKTYTVQHNTNAPDMESLKAQILEKVREDWDRYVSQKNIFDAQVFDTAIADMQSTANTYINS